MKLVKFFLQKKAVTLLLLALVLAGGLLAYIKMGKLEDAPFTIKQAMVLTPYPGASPSEVQSQVTDILEESIQSLGELYYLKTENRAGLSKITVYVKKEIRADEMQQLWDKLRRKVNDVQGKLPAGAGPSVVNDDFGDVLGVFYGLTGEGHTYRELEDEAKLIKNEFLKIKDVAKVEIYGTQTPTIDVSVSPSVMARSGITTADIAHAFEAQNKIVDAGGIDAGSNRIRIESTGNFYSLDDIRNLTIVSRSGEHFRLADIARIEESYQSPASNLMRINGQQAVGIAISTVPTGNVVDMAKAVKEKYNKPCITVGNIRDPQVAEDILAGGDADFIGMGRGLIADPEWVNKVEFGNVCDIRKCISCNIGCAGHRIGLNQPIRCTVNPAVNSGEDYMKTKVNKPCNVVVIGGGTAGLEAACTAAEVGCTTFLIEKKAELGGLASVISKIPDKKRLADFPNYMIHRASKLHNLFVFKNTSATVDMVKALNPDIIVNATGSVPTLPPITGLHDLVDKDGTNVATVLKMIERINEYPEDMKGQKIAIIGGGAVGLDVMEFFTERGAEVTMVEMLPMIGNGLDPVTKCDTNAKMAKYGVKQMTNTALQEVKNDRFIVKNPEGEIEEIPFDYGFICLGMRANTPVLSEIDEAFRDTNVEIVNIGDSKRARRIIEGTEEGRNILNVLARHDYL